MRVPIAKNLTVQPLKRTGGETLKHKLQIIRSLAFYRRIVNQAIDKYPIVHTRAPSIPATFAILRSFRDKKRVYWHKYAGSWVAEDAPVFYAFQRWLLKRAKNTIVAINGRWPGQQSHIISLENPCLSDEELREANSVAAGKRYDSGLNICFVGRLEAAKGLDILLDALNLVQEPKAINKVFLVGPSGSDVESYKRKTAKFPFEVIYTGAISRDELNKVYGQSHIFCLPSESEGFPKVLAEAASFGCVPVVTPVSSIGQYFNADNAIILHERTAQFIATALDKVFADRQELRKLAENSAKMGTLFTYSRYNQKIWEAITRKKES
jgi:glycosyltransferase involved in cell wall biosynthesis